VPAAINLFDEHLPERTLVVLSGTDLLCPTVYVRQWLEDHTSATVLYHATASHGAGLLLHLPWQCTILNSVLSMVGVAGEAGSAAAAAAAAVAESAAAGPDKAAVVAAGHGPDGTEAQQAAADEDGAVGVGVAQGDALCYVAAADARVLAEVDRWSDGDDVSCSSDDDADVVGNSVSNGGSSWGVLGVGGSKVGSLLRSITGLQSDSDSGAESDSGESSSESDAEDISGFDVTDWGNSDSREKEKEHSRGAAAGVTAAGSAHADAAAGGSGESSSRGGDGLWGLSGSFMSGLDDAIDLEPLKESASSLVAATYQVAAVSAGSLVGALKGSAGSLQQLQKAISQGVGQGQGQSALDLQQQQQRGRQQGRQGLVRRTRSCGADAVRGAERQRDGSTGAVMVGHSLPGH
jgi:hypothetical protein